MPAADVGGTWPSTTPRSSPTPSSGARTILELTTLATAFCPPEFTIGDLRSVYEVVWGTQLDPRNFSRKVAHTEGFVVATGDKRVPETGRPAALYRRGRSCPLSAAAAQRRRGGLT